MKIDKVTGEMLTKMSKGKPNASNMNSIIVSLNTFGDDAGLMEAQRLAHFLPQVMHESGSFKYDKEIWGPTAAQKRYEGRKDLGNTQKGDGKKFAGRTGMQLTGRGNYSRFYKWGKDKGYNPPNFVENPDLVNTDPWEGLAPPAKWPGEQAFAYPHSRALRRECSRLLCCLRSRASQSTR